jgi:hypothetical protein
VGHRRVEELEDREGRGKVFPGLQVRGAKHAQVPAARKWLHLRAGNAQFSAFFASLRFGSWCDRTDRRRGRQACLQAARGARLDSITRHHMNRSVRPLRGAEGSVRNRRVIACWLAGRWNQRGLL